MKEFKCNFGYRGRYFDIRFCAKTIADAAKILDTSTYYVKTYVHFNKIEKPYKEIYAMPYSHTAQIIFGTDRKEILFSDAKLRVDAFAKIESDKWK